MVVKVSKRDESKRDWMSLLDEYYSLSRGTWMQDAVSVTGLNCVLILHVLSQLYHSAVSPSQVLYCNHAILCYIVLDWILSIYM